MYILGISAFYHDSAATLIKDGVIIAAAEEERFSRKKHDNGFPFAAIRFCLGQAGISIEEIDFVAYYEKPLLKLERILETFVETYPRSIGPFVSALPDALSEKLHVEKTIRKKLEFKGRMYFIPHHHSHAAFAFYPSPFDKAAVVTVDGVGEYQTTTLWIGEGNSLKQLAYLQFPHSLGLFYSTITAFLGFRVNDDEYKVMGLAAHGQPTFEEQLKRVITVCDDGSFSLNLRYFAFRESFQMWSKELEELLGEPRKAGTDITQQHKDIAATLQKVTEDIYFAILSNAYERTSANNVCISGGVALNATANGKIFSRTPFKHAFIPGASGDDGASAGAALYVFHTIHSHSTRTPLPSLSLGSAYDDSEIEAAIKKGGFEYVRCNNAADLIETTSTRLMEGNVIGWYQERMEFGPRALGNRSILADPRNRDMQDRVNEIKGREDYHPFAGSVIEEQADAFFELEASADTYRYMTLCAKIRPTHMQSLGAITHVDGTCRIQTVPRGSLYYELIHKFGTKTNVPCLLDTSFNRKGEPIVESPEQALEDLINMPMDYLAIGNFIVKKPDTV